MAANGGGDTEVRERAHGGGGFVVTRARAVDNRGRIGGNFALGCGATRSGGRRVAGVDAARGVVDRFSTPPCYGVLGGAVASGTAGSRSSDLSAPRWACDSPQPRLTPLAALPIRAHAGAVGRDVAAP